MEELRLRENVGFPVTYVSDSSISTARQWQSGVDLRSSLIPRPIRLTAKSCCLLLGLDSPSPSSRPTHPSASWCLDSWLNSRNRSCDPTERVRIGLASRIQAGHLGKHTTEKLGLPDAALFCLPRKRWPCLQLRLDWALNYQETGGKNLKRWFDMIVTFSVPLCWLEPQTSCVPARYSARAMEEAKRGPCCATRVRCRGRWGRAA